MMQLKRPTTKRLGIGGFFFFLAKGIVWLILGKAALSALCN
jgi:hypothetical protein